MARDDDSAVEAAGRPQERKGLGRLVMWFMGPPDLGDPDEAPPTPSGKVVDCPSCGRSMALHTIDRSQGTSLTVCPAPA
ncbi:hypothetical protein [Motilibacter peucedani]|uniref:hypothetical protein n=1 Tax=Motilibacter peucedani TaxID=598650 RepID=UPI0011C44DF1|nr:hypothetical protein [Motilibacter peucedani]